MKRSPLPRLAWTGARLLLAAAWAVIASDAAARAATEPTPLLSLREDFSSTAMMDSAATTASWNTADGSLSLPVEEVEELSSLDLGLDPDALDLVVAGVYAYATGEDGTRVIHLPPNETPRIVAELSQGGATLAWSAGRIFLIGDEGTLRVIDVRRPTAPIQVGSLPLTAATDLHLWGRYALVCDEMGLRIVDVSEAAEPALVATLALDPPPRAAISSGSAIVVARGWRGVSWIDARDPASPVLVSSHLTIGSAEGLAIDGDHLFVVTRDPDELCIFDVSDPSWIEVRSRHALGGRPQEIALFGRRAIVATDAGLELFDVHVRAQPVLLGRTEEAARGLGSVGARLHVIGGSALRMLRLADLVVPAQPHGRIQTPHQAYEVQISDGFAFVPDYDTGLLVFDVRNPDELRPVGGVDTPGSAVDVALWGDLAYLSDHRNGGIQVLDISNPRGPRIVGHLATPKAAVAIEVAGDRLCVGFIHGGLSVYDIRDPLAPVLLANLALDSVRDIAVSGNVAYLAVNENAIAVVDVAGPAGPVGIGEAFCPGLPTGIALSGSHALVAAGIGGVQVFDVQDPRDPTLVGEVETPGYPFKIDVVGDHAFVADHVAGGLQFLDVSDPSRPVNVTGHVTGYYADGVAVAGELAFLADGQGLQAVQAFRMRPYPMTERVLAQSTPAPSHAGPIVLASLQTEQSGEIEWSVSADDGEAWTPVSPNGAWVSLAGTGDRIAWRARLASAQARCEEIKLSWRCAAPVVTTARTDAGNPDNIAVEFLRSGHDRAEGSSPAVDVYLVEMENGTQWSHLALLPADGSDAYSFGLRLPTPSAADRGSRIRIRAVLEDGSSHASPATIWTPQRVWLAPNSPNPFGASTTIAYDLPVGAGPAQLLIYDLRGRLVRRFVDPDPSAGRRFLTWDGRDESERRVAAGIYFYELRSGDSRTTRKMLLLD